MFNSSKEKEPADICISCSKATCELTLASAVCKSDAAVTEASSCELTTEELLLPAPSLARPGDASTSLRANLLAAAKAGDVSLASMLSARATSASSSSSCAASCASASCFFNSSYLHQKASEWSLVQWEGYSLVSGAFLCAVLLAAAKAGTVSLGQHAVCRRHSSLLDLQLGSILCLGFIDSSYLHQKA